MDDIKIERDEAAEDYAGIRIEGCSAGTSEDGEFSVIGEATTKSGKPAKGGVEIQVTVYDGGGRIVGRGHDFMYPFGLRQSFEIHVDLKGRSPAPAMVRIFPTKND